MGWLVFKKVWAQARQTLGRETRLPKGLLILLSLSFTTVEAASVSGSISRVGDATHLEFTGLKEWKYRLEQTSKTSVEIYLPPFDEKTLVELQTWTDRFIDQISIDRAAADGQYKLTVQLKKAEIETFDYLTDEPSRLIIDIFEQPQVAESSLPEETKSQNVGPKPKDRRRAKLKTSPDVVATIPNSAEGDYNEEPVQSHTRCDQTHMGRIFDSSKSRGRIRDTTVSSVLKRGWNARLVIS